MRFPSTLLGFHLTMLGGGACLLLICGCASPARPAAASRAPAKPPPIIHAIVGEIAIVDEEERFVLIDLGSNLYVPTPGALLRSSNAAGETAHLKASLEQKRPFVAADIVDGQPMVGDEVVR